MAEKPYKKHFRSMMTRAGYNSPGDIPAEKKKAFFAKVDRSWHAKDEGRLNRAQSVQAMIGEFFTPHQES